MATGTSLGPLLGLATTVFGIVGMIVSRRARRARRNGTAQPTQDEIDTQRRKADQAETARRMAAYLASRPRPTDQED